MSKIQRFINLFSKESIHFIQPCWKQEQWKIAAGIFKKMPYPSAAINLEVEFTHLTECSYSKSFNLARSAIQVALEAFQFPSESEVLLPSFICAGVITPVISAGLSPVLVDVDQDFNISALSISKAITGKTKAIILPLLSGKLARDFFKILEIARNYNLRVIIDASQALGLTVLNKWVGHYGDAGVYSFNGGKLFPNSGGGILVTSNEQIKNYISSRKVATSNQNLANRRIFHFMCKFGLHKYTYPIFTLKDYLMQNRKQNQYSTEIDEFNGFYPVEEINNIEAELVLSQLKFVPEIIQKRQNNARYLLDSHILQELGFVVPEITDNIFTKFLVTHENSAIATEFRKNLITNGIETEQSYTPLSNRKCFSSYKKMETPYTNRYWNGAFSIPISSLLEYEDIDRIIQTAQKMKFVPDAPNTSQNHLLNS